MRGILSGGTGTPKLLQGFGDREDLCIVVNVAEDCRQSGGYLSPDLDTVIYTLAGIVDEKKWYGIHNDTYATYERMVLLGYREPLKIGDSDRGTKIARNVMLERGMQLSEVTRLFCEVHGIKAKIFPASDEKITTRIKTASGMKSFHEFWVRDGGKEEVSAVLFEGLEDARMPEASVSHLSQSKWIIIGPSNPVTSISPIVGIREWKDMLKEKKVIAVSPFLGRKGFSGPASNLMRGCGYEPSPRGVAHIYKDFLDILVIHTTDTEFKKEIEDMGIEVLMTNIILSTQEEKQMLASFLEGVL
jgi:LPPG:FO 2-phospho-L-lactate transferase